MVRVYSMRFSRSIEQIAHCRRLLQVSDVLLVEDRLGVLAGFA